MLKKWLPVLLVTFLLLVLVSIKVYPTFTKNIGNEDKSEVKNDIQEDSNSKVLNNEKSPLNVGKHRDNFKEDTFPFNLKEEEEQAKKYPNQFNIVEKMYYSWDYLHSIKGEYEYGNPRIGEMELVEFYVDFDEEKNRAKFEQLRDGKVVETINLLFKEGVAIRQKPEMNIFNKETVENNHHNSKDSFLNFYLGAFNNEVTNSEWRLLIYNNYPDWTYEEATEFDMPVYKIEGTISENISEMLAGPFTMTVSKETGILLDLKAYGQSNDVILSMTVNSIEINKDLPNEVFHLDVTGDKEVSNKEFNISGMENYEKKNGGVDTSND